MRPGRAWWLCAAASALTGCVERAPTADVTTVDSAGIRIVTSPVPTRVDTIGPDPVWRVVATPTDDAPLLFDVGDLVAMASGGVAVANAGTHQVVAIDAEGRERWRFGRRGDGPGEFTGSISLAALGDTVVAFDFITRRLVWIAPDGMLGAVRRLDLPDPNLVLVGGRPDGTLVFRARHLLGPAEGINRDSVVYLAVGADGTRLGEIGWSRQGNVDLVMGEYGPNIHDQAFGPTGMATLLGSGVVHADGDRAEVIRRDDSGVITQMLRWHEEPVAVTADDREHFAVEQRAMAADAFQRRQLDEWLDRATWSATKPVTGLLVGRSDGVLLVAGTCEAAAEGCPWREFDATGQLRRRLWLPVVPSDAVVAGDLLVTVTSDARGVERLEGWRLPAP